MERSKRLQACIHAKDAGLAHHFEHGMFYCTSEVTGRHRVPKRKLRNGYRAPPLKRTMLFYRPVVWYRVLSLRCVYSKFGRYPRPLRYTCAKFRFFTAYIAELAHGEKSLNHSLTYPAYLMPWELKLSLRKNKIERSGNYSTEFYYHYKLTSSVTPLMLCY